MEQETPVFNDQERRELPPVTIELIGLADYSGVSLSELAAHSEHLLLERIAMSSRSKHEEEHLRQYLSLDPAQPFSLALRERLTAVVQEYKKTWEQQEQSWREQIEHSVDVAQQHDWLQWEKPVRVIFMDKALNFGLEELDRPSSMNFYEPEEDVAQVDVNGSHRLLTHEIGHLLSTNTQTRQSSFGRLEKDRDRLRPNGLVWLAEGATVMWEDYTVDDNSTVPDRGEQWSLYDWYRDMTKLLLREININDETLMKAYFGDERSERQIRTATQARFGCALEDLDCLMVQLDIDFTRRIVRGEPVTIDIHPQMHRSAVQIREKLAKIFPNVTLVWEDEKMRRR